MIDFQAFADELEKIAAAPSLAMMEKVISKIPVSRRASLFHEGPHKGVWRRNTLSDIAEGRGLPEAVKVYRSALRAAFGKGGDMPLAERLKGFKDYKSTGSVSGVGGIGSKRGPRVRGNAGSPIGGEGTVKLVSYGPKEGLEAALKDPASRLEPFHMPGKTQPVREGLFFWEGKGPASFTRSPRGMGDAGVPAKLTIEVPRSKVFGTGKHRELSSKGERVVSRDDILRHGKNPKVDELEKIARVPSAVKQYRRALQMMEQGALSHRSRDMQKVLSSGKIKSTPKGYHGPGAYFAEGRNYEKQYGPHMLSTAPGGGALKDEVARFEGVSGLPWARTFGKDVPVSKMRTLTSTVPHEPNRALVAQGQKMGLRIVEGSPHAAARRYHDFNKAPNKAKLIRDLRRERAGKMTIDG